MDVEEVIKNKKYKNFPKDFVEKILRKNMNKQDPVKETRKQLREVFLMYGNLDRKEDVKKIWEFVLESRIKIKKVLDLGCGRDYEFFSGLDLEYTGVDIIGDDKVIIDDILEPKKEWQNENYDVILLLNVIPVLEKLEKGSGEKLLERMRGKTKYFVLSFPFYSLSNRKYIGHFWKNYIQELKKRWKVIAEEQDREGIIIIENYDSYNPSYHNFLSL